MAETNMTAIQSMEMQESQSLSPFLQDLKEHKHISIAMAMAMLYSAMQKIGGNIKNLATLLNTLSQYQNYISNALNSAKSAINGSGAFTFVLNLEVFYQSIENNPNISASQKTSITDALGSICSASDMPFPPSLNTANLYNVQAALSKIFPGADNSAPPNQQEFVNNFNTLTTNVTSISNITQQKVQFQMNDDKSFAGLFLNIGKDINSEESTIVKGSAAT